MAREWRLHFPEFPPGPNDRMHYQTRARWMAAFKSSAHVKCRLSEIPALLKVRLSAVYYRKRIGQADEDNDRARLKPVLDGIVAAGVIPNDTRQYVQWGDVREERGTPLLEIIIEEIAS